MANVANLLTGSVNIYVADYATSLPSDLDSSTNGTLDWSDWVQFGYKAEGLELEVETEFLEKEIDEAAGVVKRVILTQSAIARTIIAEADFTNIVYSIPGATRTAVAAASGQNAQDIIKFGGGTLTDRTFCVAGKSPEGFFRVVHLLKCNEAETFTIKLGRTEWQDFGLAFACLHDMTEVDGERLVHMYDMTAVAS